MSEWQPIETAPRDASEVLTYSKAADVEMIRNSFFDEEYKEWMYYTSTCGIENFDAIFNPTHWMPLPPPPSDGG